MTLACSDRSIPARCERLGETGSGDDAYPGECVVRGAEGELIELRYSALHSS